MDAAIRSLEALRKECQRAASMYPAICHQQFLEFGLEMTAESWRAFAAANSPPKEWQVWHGPVEGENYDWFGRFSGAEAGLTEFKQLAESLSLVIRKIEPVPREVGGYEACLDLLHEVAGNWPTALVRSKEIRWGLGEDHEAKKQAYAEAEDLEKYDALSDLEESTATDERGIVYPVHPVVETIRNNLFSAVASLIEMILNEPLFISDKHFTEPDYPVLREGEASAEGQAVHPPAPVIIVKKGHEGLQLHTRGRPPVLIPPEYFYLFLPFLVRLLKNASKEIVPWHDLHDLLGEKNASPTKASNKLRKALDHLRDDVLAKLGDAPDGEEWLVTSRKSKGCHLNGSCRWLADKAVHGEYGKKSEFGADSRFDSLDPKTMEENTVDTGDRRSSQPRSRFTKGRSRDNE